MCQYIIFFNQKIGTFPIFIGAGLLALTFLIAYQIKKFNLDNNSENKIMVCIPLSVLFGCITGYFSDVIFRGGIKAVFSPWGYGMTFYGWLLGCILFYTVYSKILNIRTSFLLNFFLPAFSLAQSIGRVGCFLGGCCFGCPVSYGGISYPKGSLPYSIYKDALLFPVQLWESFYLLIVFFILFFLIKFKYRAAVYLLMLSGGRFVFEFLRGDNRGKLFIDLLSPAQIISLSILFCTIIFLINKIFSLDYRQIIKQVI